MIYACKFGYDGSDPEVQSPEELGVDVGKLGTIADWIKKEDWSSVL